MLRTLVDQLLKDNPEISIRIYDDGSEEKPIKLPGGVEVVEMQHHGKVKYFMIWNRIFEEMPEADYYFFFPDDVTISHNFFDLAIWEFQRTPGIASLQLINDRARMAMRHYRGGVPTLAHGLTKIGWWDMCGILSKTVIDKMRTHRMHVPSSRWKYRKQLGSGLDGALGDVIDKIGGMYRTKRATVFHGDHESHMHPKLRKNDPLMTHTQPDIVAGMATIPGREAHCLAAIRSLIPQVDELFLVLNDFGFRTLKDMRHSEFYQELRQFFDDGLTVTKSKKVNLGDAEKFQGFHATKSTGFYYFAVDDDIVYPEGYVWKLVERIEHYGRSAVVGIHGKQMKPRISRFYSALDRVAQYHTTSALAKDQVCNCLGTGTMAFHNSAISPRLAGFELPNMADIWMGIQCQQGNIPQISINRKRNYLRILDLPEGATIYDQHKDDDRAQVAAWNSYTAWEQKTAYIRR